MDIKQEKTGTVRREINGAEHDLNPDPETPSQETPHEGEKTYKCEHCNKHYKKLHILYKHIKYIHQGQLREFKSQDTEDEQMEQSTSTFCKCRCRCRYFREGPGREERAKGTK